MRASTAWEDEKRQENPRQGANCLSVVTFWYTLRLFRTGQKRDLDEGDLTQPLPEHCASYLGRKLAQQWSHEVHTRKHPNLGRALRYCFGRTVLLYGLVLAFVELGVRIHQAIFLGLLLRFFSPTNLEQIDAKKDTVVVKGPTYLWRILDYFNEQAQQHNPITLNEAYLFAFGLVVTTLIPAVVFHSFSMAVLHIGMKMRIACCSLMYRKVLRLSLQSMESPEATGVVTLMSNDANRFDPSVLFFHYLWIAPTQLFIALYFIYLEMGPSAYVGIAFILALVPAQAILGYYASLFRMRTAVRTDARVHQMNEIIQGMQVIKMYTWEYAFERLIRRLRHAEMAVLKDAAYIKGVLMSSILFTTRASIFFTVMYYVRYGTNEGTMSAKHVFFVASYYQVLRQTMTVFFPQGIVQIAEVLVALKRIQRFLLLPEAPVGDRTPIDPDHSPAPNTYTKKMAVPHVEMTDVSASFDGHEMCLKALTLSVHPGELCAIAGPVGAGKTSLLHLIMGELQPVTGRLIVRGKVSYAAQEAWLFAGTVRQNILFGRPMEFGRYEQVVRVCALITDFTQLPYGDRTVIGEKGAALSGGQKARVSLARAVYNTADIYLLDDPLAAVDTRVGKQLFDQCIADFLSDKIVVLVTHQLQHLRPAKQILLMDDGQIHDRGDFYTLHVAGLNFNNEHQPQQHQQQSIVSDSETSSAMSVIEKPLVLVETKKRVEILKDVIALSAMSINVIDMEAKKYSPGGEEGEMHSTGSIGSDVYKGYFRSAGNCCLITVMVLLFVGTQILASSSDFFLAFWVSIMEYNQTTTPPNRKYELIRMEDDTIVIVYSLLIVGTTIIAIYRSFFFFQMCTRASNTLHNRMFDSVITATMRFFNANSSGRILNRFSSDLCAVDELLPMAMIDSVQIFLNLFGAIALVAIMEPYLLVATVLICVAFYYLRQYYVQTSRSVKRLEGAARSPVIAHLTATLQGLTTIRSHGAEKICTADFDKHQDLHSSAWYLFISSSRAFGLWIDMVCTLYITICAFFFVIFYKSAIASEVGLVITQCIGLSGLLQWGMRQTAELENQMTSVERVLEFTRLDSEQTYLRRKNARLPDDWPSAGRIQFIDVEMSYDVNTPPVLKKLSFTIQPQEKIGIVGRTGAGKSSLLASLFRLMPYEGHIIIDGWDTGAMGLHDLRRKISIIPQDPVVFSGTLRHNLDPFSEYSDAAMLEALLAVEYKGAVHEGRACLAHVMNEGGTNISLGERQMVCMARALLRNNRILVLDEATANVDPDTDRFIQSTIRNRFRDYTVLTIAHRLHTIIDYDKDSRGYFRAMVDRTGHKMADNLKDIARKNFVLKSKK